MMRFEVKQETLQVLTYVQKANLVRIFHTCGSDERVLLDNPTQVAWGAMLIISRPIDLNVDVRKPFRN